MNELKDLTFEEELLVDWLATPKQNRCTQEELGEKMGVSQPTIWKWKKKAEIIDAAYKRKRELIKANDLPEILDALIKEAKKGKVNQAKLVFEWIGEVESKRGPGSAIQINISSPIPRSEEDIIDITEDTS